MMNRVGLAAVVVIAGCQPKPAPTPPLPPPAKVASIGFRVPADSEIPNDPLGVAIRRGRALLADTRDSLPEHVGNELRCFSCHLDGGTRPYSSPLVGVYSRFPQYRSRNDKINVIDDRINDCFRRSMNGKALAPGSRDLGDIVAYLAFMSRGVAPPGEIPGQGFLKLTPQKGDTGRGRGVFVAQCVRCHGADGAGLPNPDPAAVPRRYPPLWGSGSFNVGAGMARVNTAAAFIKAVMPFDRPGTLSDQDAFDLAAFLGARPRPDFGGKELDWPKGDPPSDVAYPIKAKPAKR